MSFQNPWVLLFIIPSFLLFFYIKNRKIDTFLNEKIVLKKSSSKYRLFPIFLILLLLALSRPVIEKSSTKSVSLNTIFIALDVSRSMLAQDYKPNRLEYAKKLIKKFIDQSPFKISIIIFTTNPLLITPPTSDKEISKIALESIDIKYILSKGTSFKNLLKFISKFKGKKNLVVFSDGGDFTNEKELLNLAKKGDIKIYGVKVASNEGALIPNEDSFLKDSKKHLVVTKLNPHFVNLSKLSSGRFYDKESLLEILDNIKVKAKSEKKKEYFELFFLPLLFAAALYLYIFTNLFSKFKAIKNMLPFMIVLTLNASLIDEFKIKNGYKAFKKKNYKEAQKIFEKLNYLEAKYALGITYMKEGKYKEALRVFRAVKTKDKELKSRIYFNIANSYEKMRNYENALNFYIKSMQLNPNIESLKKIEELAFKKNEKREPLPFSKQKRVLKRGKNSKNRGDSKKSGGSSNMNMALKSSNSKSGKKVKSNSVTFKKTKSLPVSSKVYELINKGYINEKNPW